MTFGRLPTLAACGAALAAGLTTSKEAGIAAEPKKGGADQILFLHIPKVAGLSFGADAMRILRKSDKDVISKEGCYSNVNDDPSMKGAAVLLRKPRKHLLSQYNFCQSAPMAAYRFSVKPTSSPAMPQTFDGWIRAWKAIYESGEWRKNMTPPVNLISHSPAEVLLRSLRMKRWEAPPFAPREGTKNLQKDWLRLDGGGTLWHHVNAPFQCYVPINPQSYRLQCDGESPMDMSKRIDNELAVHNLREAWFVGILEEYQASLCLLEAKATNEVPSYCDCSKPEEWAKFPSTKTNTWSYKKPAEPTPELLEIIDELTAEDRKLFSAGLEKFVADVRATEKKLGVKMLCKDDSAVLAHAQ
eukprot:CAMPEP_0197901900 /NCGR_PEP_ID=MMETSP1439-20131203/52170_1 /TAXON_ID=66791 /ORGANISM="Gonyaulax spinifera, Strain CCMP409" /LENGTH=356 /DNA_ID=CAMNT_0043522889 /DNA_START=48 /DNA_END=1118 /DNA_ORIENTATION=+